MYDSDVHSPHGNRQNAENIYKATINHTQTSNMYLKTVGWENQFVTVRLFSTNIKLEKAIWILKNEEYFPKLGFMFGNACKN